MENHTLSCLELSRLNIVEALKIMESRKLEPTFECFQQLPEDIRLKIWNLTLPGPRLVEISYHKGVCLKGTPTILRVCSESRKEALRSYMAYPLGLASKRSRAVLSAHVYINFQIDTLYFNFDHFRKYRDTMPWSVSEYWHLINRLMDNHVCSLAIRYEALVWKPGYKAEGILLEIPLFGQFDKLEELTLIGKDCRLKGKIPDLELRDQWQIGEISGERVESVRETERRQVESKLIKQFGFMKNGGISKKLKVRIVVVRSPKQVRKLQQI